MSSSSQRYMPVLLPTVAKGTSRCMGWMLPLLACLFLSPLASAKSEFVTVKFGLGRGGALVVSYAVPPGLDNLRLPDAQASLRRKQWHVIKGVATLNDSGIKLRPHAEAILITLSAEAATKTPDRVYPLVIPFSDGSVVINVASFVPINACHRTILRFVPLEGGHVVLRGSVYTKPVTIRADCLGPHYGGYAYMGESPVERHPAFLMVIDPGAPAWIVRGTRQALREALTSYGSRLGVKLPVRPTVYLSYSPGEPLAHPWFHSDTLSFDTMRISYVGKAWSLASSAESNIRTIRETAAHEAFHFWNGGVRSEASVQHGAWLVEGGAQLAALFTVNRAGWLDSADLLHQLNESLQRCLMQTGDHPWAALAGASISGQSYYDCGTTFNLMAAVLDDPKRPQQGFFKLWGQLLVDRAPTYSPTNFLRIATQNASDSAASKSLSQAFTGTTGSLSTPIKHLFTSLKIPIRGVQSAKAGVLATDAILGSFIQPLLQATCKAPYRYGFWTHHGYIEVDVPTSCTAFSRTKSLVAVSDAQLTGAPLSAWNQAYTECKREGTVTFTVLHGEPLSVPCEGRVPRPPRLLQLGAYSTMR